jgi:hypothetical protein
VDIIGGSVWLVVSPGDKAVDHVAGVSSSSGLGHRRTMAEEREQKEHGLTQRAPRREGTCAGESARSCVGNERSHG